MRSWWMKMNELERTTLLSALALFAAMILVFICIFRVSNVTALVIVVNLAVLSFVTLVTSSPWRYAVLAVLTVVLATEVFLYEQTSALIQVSIVVRFALTGLLVAHFASLLTRQSHKLYFDMRRLARQREDALNESHRWLGRVNALVMVISTISTKNHLHEIFTNGLEEARGVFDADSGLIYSVSEESGAMSIESSFGYSDQVLEKMKKKGSEHSGMCRACIEMAPVTVDNLATGEAKCLNLQKVHTGSCICLPIVGGNLLMGVLHIRRRHPDAFTPEDIQLAQALTYQFGLAMQRASLFEQVNRLSITDPMTGLYNYRKMTRDLDREIVRSRRYHHPFSFIMADIDHFKVVNDTHGHPVGDLMLRAVADAFQSEKREVDRVYRYGGEEFSMLLPETDWPEAYEFAEKMRRKIESLDVPVNGGGERVGATISMGVASFNEDYSHLDEIVSAADEALYMAKESGRNSVMAHASLTQTEGFAHGSGSIKA